MRLRTKFLLALLALSAGLSIGTLTVVRYTMQNKIRATLGQDLLNSVRAYQSFDRQQVSSMTRNAELIANLPTVRALMMTSDEATIQDGSEEIRKLSGADLLVLADRTGQVIAMHSNGIALQRYAVQDLLNESFQRGDPHDWWLTDNHLFEVLIQPIEFGQGSQQTTIGVLVVGHEDNSEAAHQIGEVNASEVAFECDGKIVASTLDKAHEQDLDEAIHFGRLGVPRFSQELTLGREKYLAASVDLSVQKSRPVSLFVLKSVDKETLFLGGLNRILLLLGLFAVGAGALLAYLLSTNFTRPLGTLVDGVNALKRGDYAYPLNGQGDDEVGVVTKSFEQMRESLQRVQQEQKELETRLRQAHKMEAVGRLAGGVAHDFNNLLTIIRGHSDLLMERPGMDEPARRSAEQIQKAGNRAVSMTRQLLAFSRMQVLQPKILDLNAIVADLGKMLPRLIGEHIEYSFVPAQQLTPVKADPGQVEQVLMNLAVNARDAMPEGGNLKVCTANVVLSEEEAAKRPAMTAGRYALLSVADTGIGMNEETKAHIFEPFFTTKEAGKGTGLGLATVYGIVKQSGGFIWVESTPGKGAKFEIFLPAADGSVPAEENEKIHKRTKKSASETILLVEDEAGVRELASEFLRSSGYKVLEAYDGLDAIDVASRYDGEIHLLLTDMVMPRMSGRELIEYLTTKRGAMRVVIMSGYSEYSIAKTDDSGAALMLPKPFSMGTLLAKVREALSGQLAGTVKPGKMVG